MYIFLLKNAVLATGFFPRIDPGLFKLNGLQGSYIYEKVHSYQNGNSSVNSKIETISFV